MKIVLEKGQNLFFTSDTHYGHTNICRATTNWNNADQKYSKMHAKVRSLTGTNSTMAKHYLDSTHGRHLAGYEDDHEYIKRDFLKFAKKYKTDQFKEEVDSVNEDQAADMQKIQSLEKGSMVGGKTEF